MRLLINLSDQKQGYALSAQLTKEGFENKLELIPNTDWGSPDYGSVACRIWIIDEDDFDAAKEVAAAFSADPDNPRFYGKQTPTRPATPAPTFKIPLPPRQPPAKEPLGRITTYLLVLCSLIFLFSELSAPHLDKLPPANLPFTPFLMPQAYKDLMFDYPYAYEILDKIISAYGAGSLDNPNSLPPEGQLLLKQFYNTPYWEGAYDLFLQGRGSNALLFEKEREGEFWRLATPCLLHADILHILFNMLWLAVLGKQMEGRLGASRYIFFMLIVGILSNIAQYIMGGSNFLGFSGILCGMLAFIWVRRRYTPWEGYQLQPGTLGFIAFFILLMLAIQLASFIAQYFFGYLFSPGIANTAHLTGAFIGYLLGRMKFFAWKMT